ncbi:hypothetical protein [Ideonella sp.]|uniref:hypothetical protein n=1 Tax=Ideonella sp. TaxID=1929293 RepID=UPI003BB7653B
MTTTAAKTDALPTLPWPFSWPGLSGISNIAPQYLNQPINPGWSFGNVIVNAGNSSAPALEMALVSRHSYGRQLGKLRDAVAGLIEEREKPASKAKLPSALAAFATLRTELAQTRAQHEKDQLDELREALQALRQSDPDAWARLIKAI